MSSLSIEIAMALILVPMILLIAGLVAIQKPRPDQAKSLTWLPGSDEPSKREFEKYALLYTATWIALFGGVVVTQAYERFIENDYMRLFRMTLLLLFLLHPLLYPSPSERALPLIERYSFKANVWIAIFSNIGFHWYTRYFYNVLRARYTFLHFYFITYHTFSNLLLRRVESAYAKGWQRSLLFWAVVLCFSYFTAFMETLSISSFTYYSFEDRFAAYTLGSPFYGIYFLASFPFFFRLSEGHGLFQAIVEALACSMIVLCLLDFCGIALDIPLVVAGKAFYLYRPPATA
eukprot:scaffold1885_cov161-Ochromonas_danica.AAC.20